ncbi:MAG: flagellar biosynthesis protein FlhF [Oceanococcus sp.]
MKIKRYAARDMRTALRAVQQEQGPDAVILSSHETADGIELVAAVDYDESLIRHAGRVPGAARDRAGFASTESGYGVDAEGASQSKEGAARYTVKDEASSASFQALEERMDSLQTMLQSRIDLGPTECRSSCSGRQAAHTLLIKMGIAGSLADEIIDRIDAGLSASAARQTALRLLSQRIPAPSGDVLSEGGAIALLGPTGVGKTTTAAKLAARHVLKYGQGSVQFIGTDEYRIGAQEQLAAYARILSAPVIRIQAAKELSDVLRSRQPNELILIDTAGIGGRDLSLHQQFDCLRHQPGLKRALCLSAATNVADLSLQARRFAAAAPNCLVMTKLDETSQLGKALSFVAGQKLPLIYTSDGQQVPEDLHQAQAAQLIDRLLDALRSGAHAQQESMRACA